MWRSMRMPSVIGNQTRTSSTWRSGALAATPSAGAARAPRRRRARAGRGGHRLRVGHRCRRFGVSGGSGWIGSPAADGAAEIGPASRRVSSIRAASSAAHRQLVDDVGQLVVAGRRRRLEARPERSAGRPPPRRSAGCGRRSGGSPPARSAPPARSGVERQERRVRRPAHRQAARRSAARTGSRPAPGACPAAGPRSGSAPRPRRRRGAGSSGAARRCTGARASRTARRSSPSRR